jgi:hypothetical protein
MSLWILAIGLLAVFAGIGFAKGAIRMAISFLGLLIALALAEPLGRALRPMMGTIGIVNPAWVTVVPPIIAFLLVYLIAMGLSFFVHHKVYLRYKYKHDDVDRIRWETMNRHVGAGIGLLTGAVLFFAISGLIYAAGYLTVQLSAEESNPGWIKFINSARQDMADSGFDKVAAKFQPAPKLYYDAADVLGLLYHNPLLQGRLAKYPYFMKLGEKPEFQEMATDKDYNQLIFGKAPITQIIDRRISTISRNICALVNHPNTIRRKSSGRGMSIRMRSSLCCGSPTRTSKPRICGRFERRSRPLPM